MRMSDAACEAIIDEAIGANPSQNTGRFKRHRVVHDRRNHQKVIFGIRDWCEAHASNYKTAQDAHDACKFALLGIGLVQLILQEIFEFFLWKVLEHFFDRSSFPAMGIAALGAT